MCAGKRAESLGKEKNPESGAERSRREKQVVVATPVVGALMHLCIHISALETSRKKSSSPPVRAERQRGAAEEEGGCEDDDGTERARTRKRGKKAVGVKLLRNNNTDSSWLERRRKKKKSEYMKRNDESSVASPPPSPRLPSSVPFRNIQFPSSNISNIWNILEIVYIYI